MGPMEAWLQMLLAALALPRLGLSTVFVVALVSATLFWPAVLVATAGNTVGGAISWWMGWGAELAYERVTHHKPHEHRAIRLLHRFGPKACLLSWLPLLGDPLCAVAGWLKLSFWPCVGYMAIGKFARYLTMTAALLWFFPGRFNP
jgi:membrane protein YqaA with SNARE-associated domain